MSTQAGGLWSRFLRGEAMPPRVHLTFGLGMPAALLAANLWRIHSFTIDDAYISYRYARNLANGLGLVYNPGERIEGYTNFLWTLLLALGMKLGVDPDVTAKVLGASSAFGALALVYLLARRFRPFGALPCVATWLLASTIVTPGYSVFGLETGFFVFLILAGLHRMFVETERGEGFLGSALLFALAGLTRPEAPMFLGLPMLLLGRRFLSKQNILRGLVFAAPIAIHMLWRHSYYGTWLPNTLSAKTGNLTAQIHGGSKYISDYVRHAGPVLWLGVVGLGVGIAKKQREVLTAGALALAVLGYVTLVGGDWMPYFRFLSPFEPFCFLLVDVAARSIVEAGESAASLAVAAFAAYTAVYRADAFNAAQAKILKDEKVFWDSAAGGVGKWFQEKERRHGYIAIADIGQVGWRSNLPIMDLLGLVDPVISKLPGGYTQKTGPGYVKRIFDVDPEYFVLVGKKNDCAHLPFPAQQRLINHPRFVGRYEVAAKIRHSKDGDWCIFQKKHPEARGEQASP